MARDLGSMKRMRRVDPHLSVFRHRCSLCPRRKTQTVQNICRPKQFTKVSQSIRNHILSTLDTKVQSRLQCQEMIRCVLFYLWVPVSRILKILKLRRMLVLLSPAVVDQNLKNCGMHAALLLIRLLCHLLLLKMPYHCPKHKETLSAP